MSKRLILFVVIISLFVFVSSTTTSHAISVASVDLINQERTNRGLNQIQTDENLCRLAKMLADDRESSYPERIDDSLLSNPKYKPYIKDYSNYVTAVITLNDVLIEAYKSKGIVVPLFTEEQIARQSIVGGQAIAPEITHGCSAMSSGKIGYKPYAYFIGGVKKQVVISPTPVTANNSISDIGLEVITSPTPVTVNSAVSSVGFFDEIKSFFIDIFSKLRF